MKSTQSRREKWQAAGDKIVSFLASERFFHIVIGFFLVQALWFVFSARYPMAFDENFHFGLIQLHAKQWLPFFTHQPIGGDAYGPVIRDPSYLYHYLMSWPYRLISAITKHQMTQVIFLRLIDVAMFTYGIVLFRRLLVRLGGSRALSHTVLLLFSLLPITAFLAATINYDDLFIPLVAWTLLATFSWFDELKAHRISVARMVILLCVSLLACLVKYAFLPISAAVVLFMIWQLWLAKADWPKLRVAVRHSFRRLSRFKVMGLVLLVVVSLFLFTERYGVNVVRYHALDLSCGRVLSVKDCSQYGPWERNYVDAMIKPTGFKPNPLYYLGNWIGGMWRRSFFAINWDFNNKAPLPIPGLTAAVLAIASGVAFVFAFRKLFRRQPYRQLVFVAMILYIISLFMEDFGSYAQTSQIVAVNGRYLLPFMPVILLYAGLAFRKYWRKLQVLKPFAVIAVVLLFLQGGGALTFIVQSRPSWDWHNRAIVEVNKDTRRAIRPFINGARDKDN